MYLIIANLVLIEVDKHFQGQQKSKGERTFMSYKGSSNLNDKITYVGGSDFIQDKTPTTNHENDIFGNF